MNRSQVADKLVGISEILAGVRRVKVGGKPVKPETAAAKRMVALARELKAYDPKKEIEASAKQVASLAAQFLDTHADIITQMREFEKKMKEQEAMLKAYYKDWKKDSGYEKMRREMLRQAQQCLQVGDVLEELEGDISLALRESGQIGYKEKFEILVSTLNEAEMRKYADAMKEYYRKQIAELKTGLKTLDGSVKEWSDEAQAMAEERGIKLPKATELHRIRNATVLDDIKNIIRNVIPGLIKRVREWGREMWNAIRGNGAILDKVSRSLLSRVSKARAAL